MIKINKKEECCGCNACENVCPKKCISMDTDKEGFWYPKVDLGKCIDCKLCEKVCPILNVNLFEDKKIEAYACKNKNNDERGKSSSGGIFILLCKEIISKNGVVFGASFDENFNVKHSYADKLEQCYKFMGAKYVQSEIGNTYAEAKKLLDDGRVVMFSGTPCQISGLELFLRKKYNNLLLIDIVCHGVPSPLIYKQYIKKLQKINKSEIKSINFRDKSSSWDKYNFKIVFNDKVLIEKGSKNLYMKGFLSDIYLRPSCYTCEFKKPKSSANISLGDYWGVKNRHSEFYDNKGVSLILINDKKGDDMMNIIKSKIDIIKTDYNYAIKCNPCIVKSTNFNSLRDEFFKNLNLENVEERIKKLTYKPINKRIKLISKKILKKIKK